MSSLPPDAPEPTVPLGEPAPASSTPELLATTPSTGGRGVRVGIVGATVAAVVAAVGAGTWGFMHFLAGGGPAPATAVPANALAYVAVDLDPSASQKIEALKTLKKFPALKDKLDLGTRDDLRRWFFDQVKKSGQCADLSFDNDVAPWLGDRFGFAAVPDGSHSPIPFAVIQVKDEDKAKAGIAKLDKCDSTPTASGTAFVSGYAIVAEDQAKADQVAKAAKAAPLSSDSSYQALLDKVGDPGIVTLYISKDAPAALFDSMSGAMDGLGLFGGSGSAAGYGSSTAYTGSATVRAHTVAAAAPPVAKRTKRPHPTPFPTGFPTDFPSGFPTDFPSGFPTDFPSGFPTDFPSGFPTDLPTSMPSGPVIPPFGPDPSKIRDAFKDFKGAAAVVRFHDGAIEAEYAAEGLPGVSDSVSNAGKSGIEQLPASSVLAFGTGLKPGWMTKVVDNLKGQLGDDTVQQGIDQLKSQTGLSVPEDVEALLGDGFSFAVDSGFDFDALLSGQGAPDLQTLPFGLRINGDPSKVMPVIDKIKTLAGPFADRLVVEQGDHTVALGVDPAYVKALVGSGTLGGTDDFKQALPNSSKSGSELFIDFNAGDWVDKMLQAAKGNKDVSDVADNLKPLAAFGLGGWVDGDTVHGLLKLQTD